MTKLKVQTREILQKSKESKKTPKKELKQAEQRNLHVFYTRLGYNVEKKPQKYLWTNKDCRLIG